MNITWNKNPLYTTIELDEHEKKELWYKIKVEEYEDILFGAHFHLQDDKYFDVEKARKELDPSYYCTGEKSPLDKRCDEMVEYYIVELKDKHAGDCTCIPCSCSKCHAEGLININTIKGLGKHSAYKIDNAFGEKNEKTIDEAIEYLATYNPVKDKGWEKSSQEEFDKHIPRWKAEAKLAHEWLVNYKKDHFNDE